jgi:reactive intermediate/imine deaminase
MARQIVKTDQAPAAIGTYSQGVVANGLLYTAGQIPLTPAGDLNDGDIQAQTKQCLENIRGILQSQNAGLEDLVKLTVFVANLDDFDAINAAFVEFFGDVTPPARSLVEVSALPKRVPIEIEAIAAV